MLGDVVGADPIDVHVGRNIRARRRVMSLSQQALAGTLGVSFQQVQKYENGTNRVSASALWRISQALGCSANDLFEGNPTQGEPAADTPEAVAI